MADTPSARSRLQSIARRVMVERGLQPEFSRGAMAQARAIPDPPPASDGLRDLTSLPWCSIDNDDSRDLDQLSVAEPGSDGRTIVRVAIADVDALVPRGSPIDDHARANTTSVYTPAQIFPMLPERLSTALTSLVQDEPRAAPRGRDARGGRWRRPRSVDGRGARPESRQAGLRRDCGRARG